MRVRIVWIVAATVLGMVCAEFTRSLRARRHRTEIKEQLVRWEGEGGNVVDASARYATTAGSHVGSEAASSLLGTGDGQRNI